MADVTDLVELMGGDPPPGPKPLKKNGNAKRKDPTPKGHAWRPGTGPEGETCRTCANLARTLGTQRAYLKCGLMRAKWTRSRGTDVLARDPACKFWEAEK